jgi:hypothetical protein
MQVCNTLLTVIKDFKKGDWATLGYEYVSATYAIANINSIGIDGFQINRLKLAGNFEFKNSQAHLENGWGHNTVLQVL